MANVNANVPGVSGVTGFIISNPQAPPEDISGGPANPYHGHPGEQASPYPWLNFPMGPYPGLINPDDGIVGELTDGSIPAGIVSQDPTADLTPAYHAAPFPNESPALPMADQFDSRGRREGSIRQLYQSLRIHANNTGASLKRLFDLTLGSKQDSWIGFYNPVQGEDLVPAIPGSVSNNAGGYGANDHTSNAWHKANQYNFNTSHRHRRYATGSVPGNYMYLIPGARPMVRSFTNQYNFQTSGAFAGDDPGAAFSTYGAILEATPSEYNPPALPVIGPVPATEPVPVISYY
jgi:hypothetical protein